MAAAVIGPPRLGDGSQPLAVIAACGACPDHENFSQDQKEERSK